VLIAPRGQCPQAVGRYDKSGASYRGASEPRGVTMANEEHVGLLKQGVEVWNAWRQQEAGDLLAAPELLELYGDLSGAILRGEDLCDANLIGANLGFADLSGTHLFGADCRGASFNMANLLGTDFRRANLSGQLWTSYPSLRCLRGGRPRRSYLQ
jgi:uncharacterized protein YjbI with pentapeptide repeats